MFYQPQTGWRCWVIDEAALYIHNDPNWVPFATGATGLSTVLNVGGYGATTKFELLEEELVLSGSSVDSTVMIPQRAIVFAVTTRTTQVVTGASSYDCGIVGEIDKYGGLLSIAEGSVNSGVTGPTAYYADTPVRISANGGSFTGGMVRLSIHFMLCTASTS
jgi:hypothetical protein